MLRKVIGMLCLLPAALWLPFFALEEALLQCHLLDTGDRRILGGPPGTASEELLNVWTWDAIGGLLCLLTVPGLLVGVFLLQPPRRPRNKSQPGTAWAASPILSNGTRS